MNISINTEKLIEIIREDVDATQPHTLVGTSEVYIGTLKGNHITLKVYSHDDAEEERIPEQSTRNFVISEVHVSPSDLDIQKAAEIFPLGQKVKYFPLLGDKSNFHVGTIRSEPWDLCGEVVVKVTGKTGGLSVAHLECM